MKRLSILLLIGLLLVGCAGLDNFDSDKAESSEKSEKTKDDDKKDSKKDKKEKSEDVNQWLQDTAYENVEGLIELASDESYILLMNGNESILDMISEWSDADIDTDEDVVIVKMDYEDIMSMPGLPEDVDELSDEGMDMMQKRMGASIGSIINGRMGSSVLAASSIVQYGKSYVALSEIDNQTWMIPSDKEGLAYCVSFTNSGDGVISVGAYFLYYGDDTTIKKAVRSAAIPCDIDTMEIDWE